VLSKACRHRLSSCTVGRWFVYGHPLRSQTVDMRRVAAIHYNDSHGVMYRGHEEVIERSNQGHYRVRAASVSCVVRYGSCQYKHDYWQVPPLASSPDRRTSCTLSISDNAISCCCSTQESLNKLVRLYAEKRSQWLKS